MKSLTDQYGKSFRHRDRDYEVVVALDDSAAQKYIVKALRDGKEFLLTLPGGVPSRVRYDIKIETAVDLLNQNGRNALEYLVDDLASKIREFA